MPQRSNIPFRAALLSSIHTFCASGNFSTALRSSPLQSAGLEKRCGGKCSNALELSPRSSQYTYPKNKLHLTDRKTDGASSQSWDSLHFAVNFQTRVISSASVHLEQHFASSGRRHQLLTTMSQKSTCKLPANPRSSFAFIILNSNRNVQNRSHKGLPLEVDILKFRISRKMPRNRTFS